MPRRRAEEDVRRWRRVTAGRITGAHAERGAAAARGRIQSGAGAARARRPRTLAEAEKRRQQPDEVDGFVHESNFGWRVRSIDSLVDLRTGRRRRPRPRPGQSTLLDPPVPPPQPPCVSIAADRSPCLFYPLYGVVTSAPPTPPQKKLTSSACRPSSGTPRRRPTAPGLPKPFRPMISA